jgi:putative polymerase
MTVLSNPVPDSTGGQIETSAAPQTVAAALVFAAVIFNLLLCFINTTFFELGAKIIIGTEITVIATALGLIWYRGHALYAILLLLAAYFFVVMLIRSEFDPKIVRDLLIPIVFFFFGIYLGSLRSADRLMVFLIFVAFGVALFEWLSLNTYLHYFDVIHYYLSRGTDQGTAADTAAGIFIKSTDTIAGLFINATRFDERTLLPFLGQHRVSGIFLEPVSAGNFAAVAFAWVLLRDRFHIWTLLAKTAAIATILVLADARFGCYVCISTLMIYLAAPLIRPTVLFVAPFLVIIALVAYAGLNLGELSDNTLAGRMLSAGNSLLALGPLEVLGLRVSEFFATGYAGDSGYGYALVKIGLVGIAASWALFIYAPVLDDDAWRFKAFIAFYIVSLLTISASLFSIKTAALLWFLFGTLNNPQRSAQTNSLMPTSDDAESVYKRDLFRVSGPTIY